jgi:periplasmic copper chaperone A
MKRIVFALMFAAASAHAAVTARDAWVRGTVPGQSSTGAFVTLESSEPATLVGVETPAARHAEVHASDMKDGVMRMRPAGRVALPPGKPVELQGATHVMLMELTHPLGEGERVPLTLIVEDAKGKRTRVEVVAPVRPLGR